MDETVIPDTAFQRRFIQCILNGLCSIINIHLNPKDLKTPNNKSFHEIGIKKVLPSCVELTYFLMFGETNFPLSIPISMLENKPAFRRMSLLKFYSGHHAVHEMIHITSGIGFSKVGHGFIYFHTIDDIIAFYQNDYLVPISIKELEKDENDDFAPPSSSSSFGMFSITAGQR